MSSDRSDRSDPPRPFDPVGDTPRPISIWRPATVDGAPAWVRPEPGPLGDHHATTRVLRPKGSRAVRRICLLGESAAAGYLYAPHVTPARILSRILQVDLRAADGAAGYEVIDLSRTNETLGPMVDTAEAALQLEPDLLLIYAGNNWPLLETPEVSPLVPSPGARRQVAAALAQVGAGGDQVGVAGPVGLARKRLAAKAEAALARLAEVAAGSRAGSGIPVLLLLPEVNLADWESRQPPVWLPGDGSRRWHELYRAAVDALGREDWDEAERCAWRMNALDGSSCPTPFRVLARAWQGKGLDADARDAALAEVDAVHYPLLCFLDAPRATTEVRRLLTEAAGRHGFSTVDLRDVFARHTGSPLPGRRLFLDYCHLTLEGMQVAMAAAAEEIRRLCPLPNRDGDRDGVRDRNRGRGRDGIRGGAGGGPGAGGDLVAGTDEAALDLDVPPAAEATARLGAALHGAHRLLPLTPPSPPDVLRHWCAAALRADPGIARAMVDLAAARLALVGTGSGAGPQSSAPGVPAVLTEPFRRLQASPYRMTLQHGLRWNNLDGAVLRAMAAALAVACRPEGWSAKGELESLVREAAERLWGGRSGAGTDPGIDLVGDERFLAAPLERLYPEAMEVRDLPGRATLRAFWPVTGFELPVTGREDLRLVLTARLPPVPGLEDTPRTGTAELTVDGRPLGTAPLGARWTRTELDLPRELLGDLLRSDLQGPGGLSGLVRLEIRWPELPVLPDGPATPLDEARRRLERGIGADLHPVFGEVFSLRVGRPEDR